MFCCCITEQKAGHTNAFSKILVYLFLFFSLLRNTEKQWNAFGKPGGEVSVYCGSPSLLTLRATTPSFSLLQWRFPLSFLDCHQNTIPCVRNVHWKSENWPLLMKTCFVPTSNLQPTLLRLYMIPCCQPWCQLPILFAKRQKDFVWVTIQRA